MSSTVDARTTTFAPTVFDTDAWLGAWSRATIEDQEIIHPGRPPRYLLLDSPFWKGYEDEVGTGSVWDNRPLLTVGSVYSVFGPAFMADDAAAVGALVDTAVAEAREQDAAGVMVFNLPPEAARQWAAIRKPNSVIRLDHAYSKMPGVGADPVMGDVRKNARTEWRRRWRRATERGVQLVFEHSPTDAQIDRVLELANGSAVKHDWPALYDKDTFLAVLNGVPGAHLILTDWNGLIVGAVVALEHDGKLYLWAAGTDPSVYEDVSPYKFMLYELMAQGVERGIERIEFGRGNDEFKRRHGFTGVPLWSLWYEATPGEADIYGPRLARLHDGLATAQGYDGLAQEV